MQECDVHRQQETATSRGRSVLCVSEKGSYCASVYLQESMSSLPWAAPWQYLHWPGTIPCCDRRANWFRSEYWRERTNDYSSDRGMNPAASPFQPFTSTALRANRSNAILLQTAQTTTFNPTRPKKSPCIRIVFDSGSQRYYMTEQVVRCLSLATESKQSLTIITFGSHRNRAMSVRP